MNVSGKLTRVKVSSCDYKKQSTGEIRLWWLGQAGFLIRYRETLILIDPYLSDSLSEKYRGNKYPHIRMMAPPVNPEALEGIDYYLISHSHSDHMDPGLIPLIEKNNPECKYLLPRAERETGLSRGIPENKMILMDDGNRYNSPLGFSIYGIASAHEELEHDNDGCFRFLGWILRIGGHTLYHSGDCIPYSGLDEKLESFGIDLALLPVNGRSIVLKKDGITGNFTFDEAADLLERANISFMIPHHYGMFEFNTVSPVELEMKIRLRKLDARVYPAELGMLYILEG